LRFFALPRSLVAVTALVALLGPAAPGAGARSLRKNLEQLWEQGSAGGGTWAVVVRPLGEADGGRTFEAAPRERLLVASTAKLFTAFAAAALLPADTTFSTSWSMTGRRGSRLEGNLFLRGAGAPGLRSRPSTDPREPDPAPGVTVLDSLARAVRKLGITEVAGRVLAGGGATYASADSLGRGWQWDDLPWWYAAPVTQLAVDDNALEVLLDPQRDGTVVVTAPALPEGWEVVSRLRQESGPAAGEIQVTWEGPRRVVLTGSVAPSGTRREVLALPRPELYAADCFAAALARAGVRVLGSAGFPTVLTRLTGADEVFMSWVDHPALRNVYPAILGRSQNNQAEMLLRDLGWRRGRGASAEHGLEAVRGALQALGLGEADLHLVDGSGLSRLDLATADALARVLEAAWLRAERGDAGMRALLAGLARPGERGSLIRRFTGVGWEGRPAGWLRGKTGSMDGVDALAAVVTDSEGRAYVVVSLRNRFPESREQAREWEERLVRLVAE
jgi:serine-type D-Ala-D-Ala carboxypeptidase/endopeptidase (penicillin-binding protein 4)